MTLFIMPAGVAYGTTVRQQTVHLQRAKAGTDILQKGVVTPTNSCHTPGSGGVNEGN
jgi:hypothetical protein